MRAQALLLVLAAVLGMLWIVDLNQGGAALDDQIATDAEPVSDEPARVPEDRPDLAPRPGGPIPVGPDAAPLQVIGRNQPREAVAPEPRVRVAGRVLDRGGRPLEGVVVYQLGKQAPEGTDRLDVPGTTTDAEGQFAFPCRILTGTWIGAHAFGFANTFVDGDTLAPETPLRIVMRDPLELRVVLLDRDGQPLEGEGVRVMPTTQRGTLRLFPGPASREQERYETTDENGVATFLFSRSFPVVVATAVEGRSVSPRDRWLPSPEGTVAFTVDDGVTVHLKLARAEATKTPWITVHDETGREVEHLALTEGDDGRWVLEFPLEPGSYALSISSHGNEPTVAPLNVSRGGQSIEIEARSVALLAASTLELTLPEYTAKPDTQARAGFRHQPLVFGRRNDGDFARLGWRRFEIEGWSGAGRVGSLTLRPGRYEFVVIDVGAGGVGTVEASLAPGERAAAAVRVQSGVAVPLQEILPEGLEVRSMRVDVPGFGWFQPVGVAGRFGTLVRSDEDLVNVLDQAGPDGVVLGPYPGDTVSLHVIDWEGAEHRIPVR